MGKAFGVVSLIFGLISIPVGGVAGIMTVLVSFGSTYLSSFLITSDIINIVSIIFWVIPIIAFVFGIIGIVVDDSKGMAIAGMILGIIGIIIGVLIIYVFANFFATLFGTT